MRQITCTKHIFALSGGSRKPDPCGNISVQVWSRSWYHYQGSPAGGGVSDPDSTCTASHPQNPDTSGVHRESLTCMDQVLQSDSVPTVRAGTGWELTVGSPYNMYHQK